MANKTRTPASKKPQSALKQYPPEQYSIGRRVKCARRGAMKVVGKNRRGWPMGKALPVTGEGPKGRMSVIITPTLAKMIRKESTTKVAVVIGVSRATALNWQQQLIAQAVA